GLIDNAVVGVGNGEGITGGTFSIILQSPQQEPGNLITKDAEVRLVLDSVLWSLWIAGGSNSQNLTPLGNYELLVTNEPAALKSIYFEPGEYAEAALKFNFLTEEYNEKQHYNFDFIYTNDANETIGGERFEIERP